MGASEGRRVWWGLHPLRQRPCRDGKRLPCVVARRYRRAVAKLPTIYDVAEAAGVAPSTVSRAFSRPGRVNSQTAQRIREVAAALGYRTNPLARGLSTARTMTIGLVIADITNPVYAE